MTSSEPLTTVTVSVGEPIAIAIGTSVVTPIETVTSVTAFLLKPAVVSTVIVYKPGFRLGMVNPPESPVLVVCSIPVAWFLAVMVAPSIA